MMTLTDRELAALTKRDRPSSQRRVLDALGVTYRVHPFDGTLIVSRAEAERVLGAPIAPSPANDEYEVNLEGLRKHGKAANTR